MTEKRKHVRQDSIVYLKIFDQRTGALLGRLVDISEDGIKMVTNEPLEAGRIHDLRLSLPEPIARGTETIPFQAVTRWCRQDTNPQLYNVGLQIKTAPDSFTAALRDLTDRYAFSGASVTARPASRG
jgi:hypothetical protein